ncbi:MAG: alpha/beta hydrolase [Candidatus Promineofilum sp.]|nr:alpha/beta hydrolase [Promineifilum sp.]
MIRHENFPSRYIPPRHVEVWLPPGYESSDDRYPVLYMHDGQNCFHAADCAYGAAWEAQHALARLVAAGQARPAIIAGVWNIPARRVLEYRPSRPFLTLSEHARQRVLAGMGGPPASDDYLAFLVSELKPFMDATYRTRPGRDDTFVMGSSMGGLISLYAICEYPDVFGGAGCVSTHWPAVEGVIVPYLRDRRPDPASHRLYFDYGTTTIDTLYPPIQAQVDTLLTAAGYTRGDNWLTRVFPGAPHNEDAWQARVHIPLRFLLGEKRTTDFTDYTDSEK